MRQKVHLLAGDGIGKGGAVNQELLDSDNAMVRDRASSFVLGLAGIQPASTPSVDVNVEIRAGSVTDISDDPPPMR